MSKIPDFLPYIVPTKSYKIWNLNEIVNENVTGVYVFWDMDSADKIDRLDFESPIHLPVYIGKAYKTEKNSLGSRLDTHIKLNEPNSKDYAVYFYGVDLYIFDKNKDIQARRIMEEYGLSDRALADLYEFYFIHRRIPYFNKEGNHHAMPGGELGKYYKDKMKGILEKNHRKNWYNSSSEIKEAFDKYNLKLS